MHELLKPQFSEHALKILEKRYLRKNELGEIVETPAEMLWRVAEAIASAESSFGETSSVWAEKFYEMMAKLEFLPNSPTLMNAGTAMGQLAACFVLPVGDNMEEIFDALKATALIHKSGGGTGFNFSSLRPKGDIVRSTSGIASGPISFMELFDHTTEVVKQGGTRRGANMGILEISHPDILEFLEAKSKGGRLSNFNLSVGIPDAFMKAVEEETDWPLVNPRNGQQVGTIPARETFELISEMAWRTGDPGLLFMDRLEEKNPTPEVGKLNATNPCGEQPLLPYESCNLGSINLVRMLNEKGDIDWPHLEETVKGAVRFLDDVIECNHYPFPEIEAMTHSNRKIGLGVMGWAELLFALRIPYGSDVSVDLAEKIMGFIQKIGHEESSRLAKERGSFPNWERSLWKNTGTPMRNATVTTIAPTGTISLLADCSSGIEPVFALAFQRKALDGETFTFINPYFRKAIEKREDSKQILEKVLSVGSLAGLDLPQEIRDVFVTAHDLDFKSHVLMQAAFQRHTDNAVSKTINFPHEATVEDVRNAYWLAFEEKCKGITVYRDKCKETQVLYAGTHSRNEVPTKNVSGTATLPKNRPTSLKGITTKIRTSFGNLYLTLNELEGQPFEVFATLGKSGKDTQAHTEALGRLISLALRSGIPAEEIIAQLKGIGGSQPVWEIDGPILSLPDAIARGMERMLGTIVEIPISEMCPACGAPLIHSEGCLRCCSCDYSKCQ